MITGLLAVLICWKWGDWKNWEKYYPTILYFILIDLVTNFLTAHHPLWEYEGNLLMINHTFSNLFIAFAVYPAIVMIYIPYYPKKLVNQILYILLWTSICTFLEYISFRLGYFSHHNGWHFGWTIGFDITMFAMLRLHYQRPLLTWPLSAILMTVTLWYLGLPLNSMK
ncbi:MAG: CBO0543 family protein [Bacillota bacterium]